MPQPSLKVPHRPSPAMRWFIGLPLAALMSGIGGWADAAVRYDVDLAYHAPPVFGVAQNDAALAVNDAQRVLVLSDNPGPSYAYFTCLIGDCLFTAFPAGPNPTVKGLSNFGQAAGSVGPGHAVAFAASTVIGWDRPGCLGCGFTLDSEANDINSFGTATGWAQYSGGGAKQAFKYTQANGMVSLGTLGGSSGDSEGRSINEWGAVAGVSAVSGGAATHAFRHDINGMTDLGTLGGTNSWAHAINDSGRVVGCANDSNGYLRAFRHDVGGLMQPLPSLPPGNGASCALAVNNLNVAVGYSSNSQGKQAVRFQLNNQQVQQVQNLNNLLNPTNPNNAYWTLLEATGTNNSGLIVGNGLYKGEYRGFVLTPVP